MAGTRVAGGQSVFFGSVGVDMDASVVPTIDGAELFAVLRSRLSQDEIRYRVALPVGATLEEHAGGAVVSRGGVVLARVSAPVAQDAQGSVVPVSMRVSGDDLLLSVSHRDREVAYPVLVDPNVTVSVKGSKGWTFAGSKSIAWVHGSSLSLGGEATFPLSGGGVFGEASLAMGVAPSLRFSKVELFGVGGYIRALGTSGWNGNATWEIKACQEGESFGGNGELTWPSTITFSSSNCLAFPYFYIWLALYGAESHLVTVAAEISVGTFLATYEASGIEEEELGAELFGEGSGGAPKDEPCLKGHPVNCATGNQVVTQTDLSVGGRGPGLRLMRTYNSQAASAQGRQGVHGPFGYGWAATDSAHLTFPAGCFRSLLCEKHGVEVYEDNGSAFFFEGESGGPYTAANPLVQAMLVKEGSNYVYTLPNQTKLIFNEAGQLTSRTDRNGNAITLAYNAEKELESETDSAGRKITFKDNSEKEVESATDPMGHIVKYTYESGNLATVTLPGEEKAHWKFKYNAEHEMTSETDGREHTVTSEYNEAHQVSSQTDAMSRKRSWKYATIEGGAETTITEPNSSETVEKFNEIGRPTSVTRASGTSIAATTTYEYNKADEPTTVTDPNKHKTEYGYNAAGDKTSEKDPNGGEKKWTYDSTHDLETETTPEGETTTIKRNSHGEPEVIERPAPGSTTQKTTLKVASNGDVESMTDPLGHEWKYEHDSYGDLKGETDPEGNKRTWEFNEDSQETATVSPRGNTGGGEPAVYATTIERDAQGRPLTVTEPSREAVYGFSFGAKGKENGQFEFPTLEAVTSSGDIWVSDSSVDRLQEFNEKGEYQAQFGAKGTGVKEFKFPFGIAINPSSGDIYVSDWENYRVQEFSSGGAFIRMFGYGVSNGKSEFEVCTEKCQAGLKGSGTKGQFGHPDGVAIDAGGNVWVADEIDDHLDEFNENGEFIKEFGAEGKEAGKIKQPVGLVYDNGNLYVAEAGNQRVQEFSTTGTSVRTFGSEGTGNGQFKIPYAITAGPVSGVLYVTDRENDRVQEFTATGHFLSSFGSKGKGSGQFELPTGVAATASENLYVSDHNNQRVQEWTGPSPRETKIAYDGDSNIESITDPDGNKTKFTYDADNERTKTEEPNKTVTETGFDSMGNVTSQTDGNKTHY